MLSNCSFSPHHRRPFPPSSRRPCRPSEGSLSNWTQALDLPKFDPSLGSLLAVSLSLDGLNETRTSVENQDTVPWSVVSGSDVTLRVLDLSGAELAALAPAVRFTNQLSESDGTVDFAGPSGIANPAQSSSLSVRRDYSVAADDLSGFIGLDSLGLSASAHGQGYYDGPGDYCFFVRTKASLTATLVYTFEPPAPVVIPAPLPPVVIAVPRPAPALGSIGDRVWLDLDANGTQDSESMASKLSAHLALFHLNLGNGFIKPTDWVKTPGIASGRCHPADLLDLAQAELLKNPCTPKSHKSRAYQQSLKIVLESANRTACR